MSLQAGVFICAGEYSGDLLAADLALALKELEPAMQLFGVTGEAMEQAGVTSLASLVELNVMGFVDVAVKLATIRMLETQLLVACDRLRPRAAILVDFPGFHFRLAEQLRLRGIPVFQYVAPKVWAWGERRLTRLRRDFDLVLGVLPFEVDYFKKHAVPYHYVGSPHLDRTSKIRVKREELGFTAGRPLISFLPGSRLSEIRNILPVLLRIKDALKDTDAQFVLPVAPNLDFATVEAMVNATALGAKLRLTRGMSLELMAVSDVCCVTSGTATLECGLLGTPMVVVYVMDELSYMLAKSKVKLPYISLVNLLLGRQAVREFIQYISPQDVATEIRSLLPAGTKRKKMCEDLHELVSGLQGNAAHNAATAIMNALSAPSSAQLFAQRAQGQRQDG